MEETIAQIGAYRTLECIFADKKLRNELITVLGNRLTEVERVEFVRQLKERGTKT